MISFRRRLAPAGLALLAAIAFACGDRSESEAVKVTVQRLQLIPGSSNVAVVLTDDSGKRFLPMYVGRDQALAIQLGRADEHAPRPLSHDLMANLLETLGAEVERVTITDLKEDTYYAELVIRRGKETHRIDARPSDAIALALRTHSPIYAMAKLLQDVPEPLSSERQRGRIHADRWGFSVQTLTEDLARFFGESEGVLVADVRAGGPADRAGLVPGDVIIRIGSQRTRTPADVEEALESVAEADQVEIVAVRGTETVEMVLER